MLDFLKAKDYHNQNLYEIGSDGNLVVEFVQAELFIYEQHASVTQTSSGTNEAFVCAAKENPEFECLDIAAATTLSGIWNPVYTNSTTGALSANPLISSNFMVNAVDGAVLGGHLDTKYGMQQKCDGGKVVGDGVINGLDLYVLGASQFRLGPYSDIGNVLSDVVTVQGRPETRLRCRNELYTRLEWQNRIAWEACFSPVDEEDYLASNQSQHGRRAMEIEAPKSSIAGLSLAHFDVSSQSYEPTVQDLGARVFLWSSASPLGRWYLINIPNIVLTIELFVRGAEFAPETKLNNDLVPEFNSSEVPSEARNYDLRFVRHRERAGMDDTDCAIVESSGSQLGALNSGTISVGQRMLLGDQHTNLCAFDLMLWIPITANAFRPASCPVEIAKGSVAMDGVSGSVQFSDACASYELFNVVNGSMWTLPSPPPASARPPPSLPGPDEDSGSQTVNIFVASSAVLALGGLALLCFTLFPKRKEPGPEGEAKSVEVVSVSAPLLPMKM
jgi:hypothetical protein